MLVWNRKKCCVPGTCPKRAIKASRQSCLELSRYEVDLVMTNVCTQMSIPSQPKQ